LGRTALCWIEYPAPDVDRGREYTLDVPESGSSFPFRWRPTPPNDPRHAHLYDASQIPAWIGQVFGVVFAIIAFIFYPALIMNAFGIVRGARQQAAIQKLSILTESKVEF
jgi:hypothetical protein